MPLVALRTLLDHASEQGYALVATNVNNMEQIQAVMEAARRSCSPAILQASRGARSYTHDLFLRQMVLAACELYPEIPLVLHQDHGNSPQTCISAIRLGFTSVMMDGSLEEDGQTPASYEYNVAVTREVVNIAHSIGVSVEGELGCIGSLESRRSDQEDGHGATRALSLDQLLTDPDQAVDFVERTGVDALAVAIGTSHGAYKFQRQPDGELLAIERILEIHRRIPHCHLVMHGSSSVPQNLLEQINRYGGCIRPTYGVPIKQIQRGIRAGVRKVNVDTDSRLAMSAAVRKHLALYPEDFDLRGFMRPARQAMEELCFERMQQMGQAGHAQQVPLTPLEEMAKRYREGYYGEHAKPSSSATQFKRPSL